MDSFGRFLVANAAMCFIDYNLSHTSITKSNCFKIPQKLLIPKNYFLERLISSFVEDVAYIMNNAWMCCILTKIILIISVISKAHLNPGRYLQIVFLITGNHDSCFDQV